MNSKKDFKYLSLYLLLVINAACWERLPLFDDKQKPSGSDTTQDWLAVWGNNSDNIWIGGKTLQHYSSGAWRNETSFLSAFNGQYNLRAIYGTVENHILVGSDNFMKGEAIYEKLGTADWSRMEDPFSEPYKLGMERRSIWHDGTNTWMAGRCGCHMCVADWPTGYSRFEIEDANAPWFTHNDVKYCTTGASEMENDNKYNIMSGIWGINADLVWTTGFFGTKNLGPYGIIFHWRRTGGGVTNGMWNEEFLYEKPLYAIWGFDQDNIWAVGGEGSILHRDGIHWSAERYGDKNLNAIWGHSATNIWAVGDGGTILHFDGSSWKQQPSPTENNLRGVYGSGPHDVWIVGDKGTVLMRLP